MMAMAPGDGKIFGTVGELPSMPSQRAFLAWDEGVETLIVESDFKGDPGDYTWIIPVPAQPSRIEALELGLLETFEQTMPNRRSQAELQRRLPAGLLLGCYVRPTRVSCQSPTGPMDPRTGLGLCASPWLLRHYLSGVCSSRIGRRPEGSWPVRRPSVDHSGSIRHAG